MRPLVDINMMVFNSVDTVGSAIESMLSQTWPSLRLTLLDNDSTDGTSCVLEEYAAHHTNIRVKRNRCNVGPIANIQRAFWFGDADYVLPKTADDLVAPDYVEQLMEVLLSHPRCVMCHAGALVFSGDDRVEYCYPAAHRLEAVGDEPLARARHVMLRYTSAPSFWGIYRRAAVDQLSTIRYRPGFDHAVLAELALYGEIRHVPELLYWRRGGGKPVMEIGRGATEQGNRGVPLDDILSEQRWRTPLITTAFTHMEVFAAARVPLELRISLMRAVPEVFRARWLPYLLREAETLRTDLPALLSPLHQTDAVTARWQMRAIMETLQASQILVPEVDFADALSELTTAVGTASRARAETD